MPHVQIESCYFSLLVTYNFPDYMINRHSSNIPRLLLPFFVVYLNNSLHKSLNTPIYE